MEVKINKEIRNYMESMFLDCPSDSSFFLSLPAAWRWVCISFSVHNLVRKTISWVYILGAFPFAAMGFIKYNGMILSGIILLL